MAHRRFPIAIIYAGIAAVVAVGCSSSGARPRIDSALPRSASPSGQTFVLIQGQNFARNADVRLGQKRLLQLTWVNPGVITAEVPGGMQPGPYDLTVANPGAGETTLQAAITVDGARSASPTPAPPPTQPPAPPATRAPTRVATADVPATASPAPSPIVTPAPTPPTPAPTPSPTPAPTVPPTSPPTAVPPAPEPTEPPAPTSPPTRAPTQAPLPVPRATQPPQPTRAPAPPAPTQPPAPIRNNALPNLSGQWTISDTVTFGPGTGGTYPFAVAIQQSGASIAGAGTGISFQGVISGDQVHASYVQDNGSTGTFDWVIGQGGSVLSGSFTNSNGNGGDSYGQRFGSGVLARYAAMFSTVAKNKNGKSKPNKD